MIAGFTPADHVRAQLEGWKLRNGFPTTCYHSNGLPMITGGHIAILEEIYKRAKDSKWHENIALNVTWNEYDEKISREHGWIFIRKRGTCEITGRNIEFVMQLSENGCLVSTKALSLLAKTRLSQ